LWGRVFVWTPILARLPKRKLPDTYIRKELKKLVKPAQQDFKSFVGTWDHKPKILRTVEGKRYRYVAFTGVYSRWSKGKKAKPEDIFMFLARGTRVRYATMSSDFKAKTKKRVIRSGPGAGKKLFVNPMNPQPGIEAREIEDTVRKKRQLKIKLGMYRIMLGAVKRGLMS
jgi:hypothetical protein